jgi:hypothetical protein
VQFLDGLNTDSAGAPRTFDENCQRKSLGEDIDLVMKN